MYFMHNPKAGGFQRFSAANAKFVGRVDEGLRKLGKGVSAQKLILYQWEDEPKSEL